jgi:prepilin-type N-terminal cleavage/methylation domain-containing protein
MIRKAFTLIELLVVIAIIAILAAILFPVFAQAKASAKQTAALSNVKQIIVSEIMYDGDYDDTQLPYVWYNRGDGSGVYLTWMELVNPYAKNSQVFLNPGQSTDQGTYGVNCGSTGKITSHYVMPLWIRYEYWNWWGTVMFAGFPLESNPFTAYPGGPCDPNTLGSRPWSSCTGATRVDEPANTAVLIPGYFASYKDPTNSTTFGSACTTGFAPTHNLPDPVDERVQAYRKGNVYAMADGHAKYFQSVNFNGNASRPHLYGGGTYPSSPFMVIKQ